MDTDAVSMDIDAELGFALRTRAFVDPPVDTEIIGRDRQMSAVRRLLNSAAGGALVMRGAPGSGKSSVLEEVARLAAGSHRHVLLVDDADRLDRSAQVLLAQVARHARSSRVAVFLTVDEHATPLPYTGLMVQDLPPLDEVAAGRLLARRHPGLDVGTRARILDQAVGNPLAIVELADAQHLQDLDVLGGGPVMTPRLRQALTRLVDLLPERTQTLLLVAAVNDSDCVQEALAAADLLVGSLVTLDDLSSATAAGVVSADAWRIHFRHPMTAAAIVQSASAERRRAAHNALAQILEAHPERTCCHAAAGAGRPDDQLADALATLAIRAYEEGRTAAAAAAWERAASLTESDVPRAQRLLRAATLWRDLERPEVASRLVAYTASLELPGADRARAAWLRGRDELLSAARYGSLEPVLTLAGELNRGGDHEMAIQVLTALARLLWSTGAGPEARRRVLSVARATPVRGDHPNLRLAVGFLGSFDDEPEVVESTVANGPTGPSAPGERCRIAVAALLRGHVWQGGPLVNERDLDELRRDRRHILLSRTLGIQAWHDLLGGRWDSAALAAEEAIGLAATDGRPFDAAAAQGVVALLAALRGDRASVEVLTAEIDRVAIPLRAAPLGAIVQAARGLLALGEGDGDGARIHLDRIFDAGDPACDPAVGQWILADGVEARLRSGEPEAAEGLLGAFEAPIPPARAAAMPGLVRARMLLAPEEHRDAEYRRAIDVRLRDVPFMRAQTLLDYGSWLRRQRRRAESRVPLRAAAEVFAALGASPWAERAEQELRASGVTSRRRGAEGRDQLSPQELEIARMAAEGLTNREIGERLYLSSRTVGSHLYRVFPKLGICSRAELGGVLGLRPEDDG